MRRLIGISILTLIPLVAIAQQTGIQLSATAMPPPSMSPSVVYITWEKPYRVVLKEHGQTTEIGTITSEGHIQPNAGISAAELSQALEIVLLGLTMPHGDLDELRAQMPNCADRRTHCYVLWIEVRK